VKKRFFDYHANTNYSVVDIDLLNELYGRMYREGLSGRQRLFMHNMSHVAAHETTATGVRMSIEHGPSGRISTLPADYLVYATGYRPADLASILGAANELCARDDLGRLRVERDYRVVTRPDVRCAIYLQGGTEHTHGISSTLLSNVAVRAGEILTSIQRRTRADLGAASVSASRIGTP
jgi:L-ornithine N5-monooxygenase